MNEYQITYLTTSLINHLIAIGVLAPTSLFDEADILESTESCIKNTIEENGYTA